MAESGREFHVSLLRQAHSQQMKMWMASLPLSPGVRRTPKSATCGPTNNPICVCLRDTSDTASLASTARLAPSCPSRPATAPTEHSQRHRAPYWIEVRMTCSPSHFVHASNHIPSISLCRLPSSGSQLTSGWSPRQHHTHTCRQFWVFRVNRTCPAGGKRNTRRKSHASTWRTYTGRSQPRYEPTTSELWWANQSSTMSPLKILLYKYVIYVKMDNSYK